MAALHSTQCESPSPPPAFTPSSAPPPVPKQETVEERMWRKVKSEPLVPVGCFATAYFLFSGIRSFQKRDPVRSQRMMRNRVIAQFVTLACFVGYMGLDQADFRLAPMVQDKAEADKKRLSSTGTSLGAGARAGGSVGSA